MAKTADEIIDKYCKETNFKLGASRSAVRRFVEWQNKKHVEYIEKMQEFVEDDDTESAHGKADKLLYEFLRELGYNELAKKYDEVKKYYG